MSDTPYLLVPTGDGDAWRCDLSPSETSAAIVNARALAARFGVPVWIVEDETRALLIRPDGRQSVVTPPRPSPAVPDTAAASSHSGGGAGRVMALPTDGPTRDALIGPWVVTSHVNFKGAPRGSHSILEFHADHTFTWPTPPEWFAPSGMWDVGRQSSAQPLLGIENREGSLQAGLVRLERGDHGQTWRWHQPHRTWAHFGPLVLSGARPPVPVPWQQVRLGER